MSPDEPASPEPRVILGRYRVVRTLGRGGMGEVLLAWDEKLNRHVALKREIQHGVDGTSRRRAILKEARRASGITDRRVAAIYDVVEDGSEVVLVMEYVDGVTLRERLATPIPIEEFWSIATQCVGGIAAAHERGLIHRDLKPENLMLTRSGELKILDFGIARRSDASETSATSSEISSYGIAGTPFYMAPEAHVGGPVDQRVDIFSLGVVFYEMLTGRRPFEGANYAVVANAILNSMPPPVSELNPEAGEELSQVVSGMLAKHPGDRVASAADLLARLDRARRGLISEWPTELRPVPIPAARKPGLRLPSHGALAWWVLGLAAAALAVWRVVLVPALPRDLLVAVLPPATPGASADFAAFALGAIEFVDGRIQRYGDTAGFQTATFSDAFNEKVANAIDARKVLGANVALVSTLEQGPDQLTARLEVRETERGRVIASRTLVVPAQKPFEFLDRVEREAATLLQRRPRAGSAAQELGIRGAGTLRFYLQGRGRLWAGVSGEHAQQAAADFESACRTEPDAAISRAGLAAARFDLYRASGDPAWLERAAADARDAVGLDSGRAEPHRMLAQVLASKKDTLGSLEHYARAAELDSSDVQHAFRLARAWAKAGDRERERALYLEVVRRRPHAWQSYWWLGTWHHRAGHLDQAIAAYEKMVERAPLFHRGHSNLGGLLVSTGNYDRAIRELRQAVALMPTRSAFGNLGTAYFYSGRFDESVEAYNQSFQFGAADASTWLNLGDAYLWLKGRKDQAEEAYRQAIRLGREDAEARSRRGASFDVALASNLATLYARIAEPDSARWYLAQALAADSTVPDVQMNAALTHWQLGDRERAIGWIERSVRGGYPVTWLRDSPVFREWRVNDRFRALLGDTLHHEVQTASTRPGGGT